MQFAKEAINGYVPLKPFSTVGAGTASWTIALKDGKEYFLKRFNAPKYVPACMDYCEKYEKKKREIYDAIRALDNGNLVLIEDFFHWGTFYYIATRSVRETSITAEQAYTLPKDKLFVLMKTLVHCMMQLERGGIVHADLKPSNVMIKPTTGGFYSLKLIDFDSSFFEADPPVDKDDLEGDMTFLSPEVLMGMCGEDVQLTCKIDVFAVGIMFHLFLTNELPRFDGDYDSVCEAVANGAEVQVAGTISSPMQSLILSMLDRNPEKRPAFEGVFKYLCAIDTDSFSGKSKEDITVSITKALDSAPKGKNPWMKRAGDL